MARGRLSQLLAVALFLFGMAAAHGAFAQSRAKTRDASGGEKRVALVVGMSGYQYIPALDNPRNDARLMAETLRGLGFELVGGAAQLDLDKPGFDKAVQDFGQMLASGADVALFYYAGHGLQIRGTNWLVPISANATREADADFQMVDANLVLRQMEAAGTRLNLMILDACRNNPFSGRGMRAAGGGLAQMQAPEGTLISYATQPGNVAMDGMDGNSPYTKALAQTLRRPGVGVFEAFNDVGLQVKRATGGSQQPWVSSSPIEGTFYFAGPAPGASTVATAPPAADPATEVAFWNSIKDDKSADAFNEYLRQFPQGQFAGLARLKIRQLADAKASPGPAPGPTPAPPAPAPLNHLSSLAVMPASEGMYDCGDERKFKSIPTSTPIALRIQNQTDVPVSLIWIDFNGNRRPYKTVEPGGSFVQSTYIFHPWLLADAAGRCLSIAYPGQSLQNVVVRK
jgi:Caspase domain/VHL beta domain